MKNFYFDILFLICLFLSVDSMRISIIPSKRNNFLSEIIDSHTRNKQLENVQTEDVSYALTTVCEKIISTYHILGEESFNNYKQCIPTYDLLGIKDPIISQIQPVCYTSLANLFCDIYITNYPTHSHDEVELEKTKNFILNSIYHCIKDEDNDPRIAYHCPSLNTETYIIKDIPNFCSGVLKIHLPENGKPETTRLGREDMEVCKKIITNYNTCIKTDNNLFFRSNYQRCFESQDNFYLNNKVNYYDKMHEEDNEQTEEL